MGRETRPGFAIYLTGLPASGKTSLANALQEIFSQRDISVQILDSDELRRVLTPQPIYSLEERDWFYEVLGFIAGLLVVNGVNIIIAATAPRRSHRQAARSRIQRFAEVYVSCPPEICRGRDPKGLWERADRREILTLPGAGVPYELPASPEIIVDTAELFARQAARRVIDQLMEKGLI